MVYVFYCELDNAIFIVDSKRPDNTPWTLQLNSDGKKWFRRSYDSIRQNKYLLIKNPALKLDLLDKWEE
jgi:hypothetical protein